ncbi:TOBE domain-containing protein [Methylicorpusculum sp.]|uniref:TOBE domain-containing protein n=1 Tax=Methylicorpusculum sp. TaxID=2713644 RepID=UPI002719B547|nr:TOBE domain-containing protein [Methylicorpusculum sp.]MDO8845656.1 TOBE domain-containing protein [Methylicorpusculum sp.]
MSETEQQQPGKDKKSAERLVEGELRIAGAFTWKLCNLLAAIESTGSLNRAAKQVGLSYKGAWEILERANNLSPHLLVTTSIGGKYGGGSVLTDSGKSLLKLLVKLRNEHDQFLERVNQELANNSEFNYLIRRTFMKASARNQFFGTVVDIHDGGINVEINIELKGGDYLVAAITQESLKNLGIVKGVEVVALIKAPQVLIVADLGPYRLSARNQLSGKISRLHKGAVNTEVVVQLPGGNSVYATVTNDSVDELNLEEGVNVLAAFKANAVFLAVMSLD